MKEFLLFIWLTFLSLHIFIFCVSLCEKIWFLFSHKSSIIQYSVISFIFKVFFRRYCPTTAYRILIPFSEMEPTSSAVKAHNPNHWTTRKFSIIFSQHWNIESPEFTHSKSLDTFTNLSLLLSSPHLTTIFLILYMSLYVSLIFLDCINKWDHKYLSYLNHYT